MRIRTFNSVYDWYPDFTIKHEDMTEEKAKAIFDFFDSYHKWCDTNAFYDTYDCSKKEISEDEFNNDNAEELFCADDGTDKWEFKIDKFNRDLLFVKKEDEYNDPEERCITYFTFEYNIRNLKIEDPFHLPIIIPAPDNKKYDEKTALGIIELFDNVVYYDHDNPDLETITDSAFVEAKPKHYFDASFIDQEGILFDDYDNPYIHQNCWCGEIEDTLFRFGTELGLAQYYGTGKHYYRIQWVRNNTASGGMFTKLYQARIYRIPINIEYKLPTRPSDKSDKDVDFDY